MFSFSRFWTNTPVIMWAFFVVQVRPSLSRKSSPDSVSKASEFPCPMALFRCNYIVKSCPISINKQRRFALTGWPTSNFKRSIERFPAKKPTITQWDCGEIEKVNQSTRFSVAAPFAEWIFTWEKRFVVVSLFLLKATTLMRYKLVTIELFSAP